VTWVKISDIALSNPRMVALARDVRLLYLELLAWRNRHLDGLDATDVIPAGGLHWATDQPDLEAALAALEAAGAIEAADGGHRLLWWVDDQPSIEEAAETRKASRQRQERHRRHQRGDHSKCDPVRCHALSRVTNGVTNAVTARADNGSSDPTPTRPDPIGEGEEEGKRPPAAAAPGARPRRRSERSEQRRQLAKAIREAPTDELRNRHQATFSREFGVLYPRRDVVAAESRPATARPRREADR
jgi:hypothetical protein